MLLHYNQWCTHHDLPTTPLRLMCALELYDEALQELERLNALPLEPSQRLVVNVHEVVVKLQTRRVKYWQAKRRLVELAVHIHNLGDENFIAEFRSRRIQLAARRGDHELIRRLTFHFFEDIPRTTITEAHWRIAQGKRAEHMEGPAAAIPYYLTALMNLGDTNRPCLKESLARNIASCHHRLGQDGSAIAILRDEGLPVSPEPQAGSIALADLLLMPC
jgi:hypothetical protein